MDSMRNTQRIRRATFPLIIQNLHLDRLRPRIARRLERLDSVFQIVAMRDQGLQIDNAGRSQTDSLGVDIVVAILELQIDFLRRHVHEGDVLEDLAHADDEDCPAKASCLDDCQL